MIVAYCTLSRNNPTIRVEAIKLAPNQQTTLSLRKSIMVIVTMPSHDVLLPSKLL
jgi:hypothetical protein